MLTRIGLPCPRCIRGQILIFHTDDFAACFQCGHEPAPKKLAEVLREFDVQTCRKCSRILSSGFRLNRSGLCSECRRRGECSECGGPTGTDNVTGICLKCFRDGTRGASFSEAMSVAGKLGAVVRWGSRSDEPELSAGGKPRGDLGVD